MKLQVYFQDKNPNGEEQPFKSLNRKNSGNKENHFFYEKFLFKIYSNFLQLLLLKKKETPKTMQVFSQILFCISFIRFNVSLDLWFTLYECVSFIAHGQKETLT